MAGAATVTLLYGTLASPTLAMVSTRTRFDSKSQLQRTRRVRNPRIINTTVKSGGELHNTIDDFDDDDDDGTFFKLMDGDYNDDDDDDDDDDDEDTESSLDLLFRFMYSMFKKLSKRAKKASHSVLPDFISPQLVTFSVDGLLLLASLSLVKALLEVVCTLGSTVFVVILMIRVIWAAVFYFQSKTDNLYESAPPYSRTTPVT